MRCFIIGSGPSLKDFHFPRLNNEITIGINYCFKYFIPTILAFTDYRIYSGAMIEKNGKRMPEDNRAVFENLDCIKITKIGNGNIPGVYYIPLSGTFNGADGLSKGLYTDYMTGIWAISLAVALKFSPIYLLGYDCKFDNGVGHFYSNDFRHKGDEKGMESSFKQSIEYYNKFRNTPGIYNCNPDSGIKVFPFADIDEVLKKSESNNLTMIKEYVINTLKDNHIRKYEEIDENLD